MKTVAALRYARRAAQVAPASGEHDSPELVLFGSGDAYPEAFPDMSDLAARAARDFRTETLQYAPRLGLPELREWIVGWLGGEGVRADPASIIVVNGAKHGLDLACKLFVEPGDTVVVTRPTYQSALGILRGYEVTFLEVGLGEDGMEVDELAVRLAERARVGAPMPKLVYDIPEFHNPTGVTMSRARRERLLDLAERYDMLVVEDDPYRRIRFEGEPVPPIAALDRGGRVLALGTFAKLVAPGLRVGWVAATPEIVGRMGALKSDGGSCPFTQRLVLEYCRARRLEPHVRDLVKTYQAHRDVMVEALRREIPEAQYHVPSGGYYLWLTLPASVDSGRLLVEALARGVRFLPARDFFATPGPTNHLRLAYSYASPAAIIEGIARLAAAIRATEGSRERRPM
jgi:2-aminoadipate transaminase